MEEDNDLLTQLLQQYNHAGISADIMEKEDLILEPLLEEISLIQDQGIRLFVRAMLLAADDLFWSGPSSASGKFHPPDERGECGNVLHTKRVVRTADIMCASQERSVLERDIVLAACILHDITKIVKIDGQIRSDRMHPYTVDFVLKNIREAELSSEEEPTGSSTMYIDDLALYQIMKCIRSHLGPYSPVPETYPTVINEWIVHLADNIAAHLHEIIDGDKINDSRWRILSD